MPYTKSLRRFSRQSWEAFVEDLAAHHDHVLMEGVVAGCALVANADGWATEDERRRMLGLIRGFEPLAKFGVADVTGYFDELSIKFTHDPDAAEAEAFRAVGRLKGRGRQAELLVETCCAIAAADGGFDAEERSMARGICEVLELDPARFDLADAR